MVADFSDINAAILAGGLGTRLRAVVDDRPKALAEVRGRPFLAYVLDKLAGDGIRRAVICTGFLGEQIAAVFGDSYAGINLVYSQEPLPLGTAGALRFALPLLTSENILVINGDTLCTADLKFFWRWYCARPVDIALMLIKAPDTQRYGRVTVSAKGDVLGFCEKGEGRGPGWINAGAYLCARRFIEAIPEAGRVSLEQEIFPSWIGRGLSGYAATGDFIDIGTSESFLSAQSLLTNMVMTDNKDTDK